MGFTKIDIRPILRAHFRTLRDARTGEPMRSDRIVHMGGPLTAALVAFTANVSMSDSTKGLIITVVALVAGGLFNLLVLAAGMRLANRGSFLFGSSKKLSRETLANIEYAILAALFCAVLLVPSMIEVRIPTWLRAANEWALRASYAACCGVLTSLGVTSLMVLRRMHQAMIQNLEITYQTSGPAPTRRLRHAQYRSGPPAVEPSLVRVDSANE